MIGTSDDITLANEGRDEVRRSQGEHLPGVLRMAEEQMDGIAECIRTLALHSAKL
ncbi:MAG: hypothetical protein RL661_1205 [Pseudomonadota bacterium]